MHEKFLSCSGVMVSDGHIPEDELFYIQVQPGGFGVGGRACGVGCDFGGFDDIELAIGFFYEVEVAVLQGNDLDVVFLLQDIGEAEPYEKPFGFVDGFCRIGFAGVKFYLFKADGDIGKMLEERDFAAIDLQAPGELSIQFFYREGDKALVLAIQDAEGDTHEEY